MNRLQWPSGPTPVGTYSASLVSLVRLQHRAFGKTNLRCSELGLGCARIGGIFQGDSTAFTNLIAAALDSGIDFFDTADMYSQGESESLLGRALRGSRKRVVIASKAGFCLPKRRKLIARLKPLVRPAIALLGIRRDQLPAGARGALSQDFSPAYLRKAVEGSLRRLKTDYLDLFQLHSPPLEVVRRGEWEPVLEELKRAGKIRHYGVSCDVVEVGLAALTYPGVSALQFPLNLLDRGAADTLVPQMRARGVAGIARECLANGLLAKRQEDIDFAAFRADPAERKALADRVNECRKEAADRGVSLTRAALEYVTGTDGVSVSLIGARTIDQLKGLLGQVAHREASGATA